MASELVASAVVKELVSKLGSSAGSEIGLLWNLKKDLEGMKTTLESIEAVLYDAENRSLKDAPVRLWLKRLKAAAYDVEDMLSEFETQNRFFYSPIMAHRLKGMRKRLHTIAEERSTYNLTEVATTNQQEVIDGRATFSAVNKDDVFGRDVEATEIINRLLASTIDASSAFSIIPIIGIGGLGKTTLAKLVFNDDRIKKVFEPRIWVHAMDFKVKKLVEGILLSSGTEKKDSLGNLQSNVERVKQLLDGNKYLIVLDDVWNEERQRWEEFRQILQGGQIGSRIIVTSRNDQIQTAMDAETPHRLSPLSYGDCLKLFERTAFGLNDARDNNLLTFGRQIVERCQGVPLTANALGGMLHFRTEEDVWREVLDSEFWQLREEGREPSENRIISSLKLSYQCMPSPLRLCFIYCSSYPKAFKLEKEMLIQQWIAQGFIQRRRAGDNYVNYLLAISFFEETSSETYKMHDLVHDLARSIAGDEVSIIETGNDPNIYPKDCRYASLIRPHQLPELLKDSLHKVRALHFQECSSLLEEIFSCTKFLRVLDFSNYSSDQQLPATIYKLKQLKYFKLSGDLREVDGRIGKLSTLEMLILSDCWAIRSLPNSIGSLQNLKFLRLSSCYHLESLPESLGNLMNLESLNINNCYNFESLPKSLGNLVNLKVFEINNCEVFKILPNSLGNLVTLETLNIFKCHVLESLPESLGDLMKLKTLVVVGSSKLRALPESIGELDNLANLDLSFSRELSRLPNSVGRLQNLQSLNLSGCLILGNLPESLGSLVKLRTLDIQRCVMLDELPKAICDMRDLKIQRTEPLEFGSDRDAIELYLIDGPPEASVVCNITHARQTNLREKGGSIKSLVYNGSRREEPGVAAMLEELQPHQNLQQLCIRNYEGLTFPSWIESKMESFLPNLSKIELKHIHNCEYLPVLGQLPKLEEMSISEMPKVRRMSEDFYWARNTAWTSFLSLKRLELNDMVGLEEWVTEERLELNDTDDQIEECMTGVAFEGERGASLFPCLEELTIYRCPKLQILPCIPSSVKTLKIMLPLITTLNVCKMSLKHFSISSAEKLVYLPESIRYLTSLETLVIRDLVSPATLPEWLGELSLLRSLEIYNIPLVSCLPQSIQYLVELKSLIIMGCSQSLLICTEKDTGEDWEKISHIEYIKISTGRDVSVLPSCSNPVWTPTTGNVVPCSGQEAHSNSISSSVPTGNVVPQWNHSFCCMAFLT